ncbi:hypothetical protein BS17DRAFT_768137 [Gyrodon lividus]|nr:hypothetical protein BS17DRAFT_768137 [Gyrodon lividus]
MKAHIAMLTQKLQKADKVELEAQRKDTQPSRPMVKRPRTDSDEEGIRSLLKDDSDEDQEMNGNRSEEDVNGEGPEVGGEGNGDEEGGSKDDVLFDIGEIVVEEEELKKGGLHVQLVASSATVDGFPVTGTKIEIAWASMKEGAEDFLNLIAFERKRPLTNDLNVNVECSLRSYISGVKASRVINFSGSEFSIRYIFYAQKLDCLRKNSPTWYKGMTKELYRAVCMKSSHQILAFTMDDGEEDDIDYSALEVAASGEPAA